MCSKFQWNRKIFERSFPTKSRSLDTSLCRRSITSSVGHSDYCGAVLQWNCLSQFLTITRGMHDWEDKNSLPHRCLTHFEVVSFAKQVSLVLNSVGDTSDSFILNLCLNCFVLIVATFENIWKMEEMHVLTEFCWCAKAKAEENCNHAKFTKPKIQAKVFWMFANQKVCTRENH